MEILTGVIIFVFGTIIGSFLGAVLCRYNTGLSMMTRSCCFACGKELHWYELVPLASFVLQRGRCRRCKSKIPWQDFLVEIVVGFLYVALYSTYGITIESVLLAAVLALLVLIFIYDYKHTIIPNPFVFTLSGIAFVLLFIEQNSFSFSYVSFGDVLAGPLVALLLYVLWLVSRGKWMGLGDSKLMLGLGWILGIEAGFSALIIAFWIGAVFTLGLLFIKSVWGKGRLKHGGKRLTIKSEIPFAPFLIAGFLVVFFFSVSVFVL